MEMSLFSFDFICRISHKKISIYYQKKEWKRRGLFLCTTKYFVFLPYMIVQVYVVVQQRPQIFVFAAIFIFDDAMRVVPLTSNCLLIILYRQIREMGSSKVSGHDIILFQEVLTVLFVYQHPQLYIYNIHKNECVLKVSTNVLFGISIPCWFSNQ